MFFLVLKKHKGNNINKNQINNDFSQCFKIASDNKLEIFDAVAYPYGNYPKNGNKKDEFISVLKQNGIKLGFRFGNKINKFPFKDSYEIMRIDIKGEDNLLKFKLKLRFGKLKLF